MQPTNETMSPSRRKIRAKRRRYAALLLLALPACVVVSGNFWHGNIRLPDGTRDWSNSYDLREVRDVTAKFHGRWGNPALMSPDDMYYRIDTEWLSIYNPPNRSDLSAKDVWNFTDLGTDAHGTRRSVLHTRCRIDFNLNKVLTSIPYYMWSGPGKHHDCRIDLVSTPTSDGWRHDITVQVDYFGAGGSREGHVLLKLLSTSDDSGTIVYP